MPVGRFVLDVHGEARATWPASDALCAALQIINHRAGLRRRTIAISTASIFRSICWPCTAPASTCSAKAARRRLCGIACARWWRAPPALLKQSRGFSGRIHDTRLALEVAVIHGTGRTPGRDPAKPRSVERTGALEQTGEAGARRRHGRARPAAAPVAQRAGRAVPDAMTLAVPKAASVPARPSAPAAARSTSPCASSAASSARPCSRSIRSAARSTTSPTATRRVLRGSPR